MFIKTIKHYIRREKNFYYNYLINRRKKRFLQLIEFHAPKEIIVQEIELLRQSFNRYMRKKIQKKIELFIKSIFLISKHKHQHKI